jgi:hypothetical protein
MRPRKNRSVQWWHNVLEFKDYQGNKINYLQSWWNAY